MRTTLDIDDHIYQEAQKKAADENKSLTRVVEDALRQYLHPSKPSKPFKLLWKTERAQLMPGVNINDRDSLYETMEGRV